MDPGLSLPGSPVGGPTPLQPVSSDRVNQQREPSSTMLSSLRRGEDNARDSSVSDKISQFNSLTLQSKQLERKTADAALKRAMLGREEAESEMRRYREEARMLRKVVEECKDRERKVGERLENVMVSLTQLHTCEIQAPLTSHAHPASTGELRPRQGNTRAHTGFMGERNKTHSERVVEVPKPGD